MSAKKQISKILLVDDDPSVRRICRIVLERAGFGVIEADCGHAAQIAWEAHAQGIDLLVTDYEMPGLTGLQLSALLRTAKPELKTLDHQWTPSRVNPSLHRIFTKTVLCE